MGFFKFVPVVISLLLLYFTLGSSSKKRLCHDNERSALLHLNIYYCHSFSNNFGSWDANTDCCLWDGVKCNKETGHVIELDLSRCLSGSFNSSSSLFQLVHLEWLNLSYNDFDSSEIPSEILNLSRLSYLNLSSSSFGGQIPSEILELSSLTVLDLSNNNLKLEKPSLGNLSEKLTNLKTLDLSDAEIGSFIPHNLGNLNSLTFLSLSANSLQGNIPSSLGNLTKLIYLDFSNNNLSGELPTFIGNFGSLKELYLSNSGFSAELPNSIGNISSLQILDLSNSNLLGELPMTIGNLGSLKDLDLSTNRFFGKLPNSIGNLSSLKTLTLFSNGFFSELPTSIGNLGSLEYLDLTFCNFSGNIPLSFGNLTQLQILYLDHNGFSGELPSSIANLKSLEELIIFHCNFSGQIPSSLGNLTRLILLDLSSNNFSGTLVLDTFLLKLQNLRSLILSSNNLSLLTKSTNIIGDLSFLGLSSCNLTEFPNFLQNQNYLIVLDLSSNKIAGQIPGWFLDTGFESLMHLNLSHNLLTGFDRHPVILPWTWLSSLDLSFNKLEGSLPRPKEKMISHYIVANNSMTGELPSWICNLYCLLVLDLSYNNLNGVLPQCSRNYKRRLPPQCSRNYKCRLSPQCSRKFGGSLLVLNLRSNNFSGRVPKRFMHGPTLRMIDLNDNLLQGRIPRSLVNCRDLEFLDLGKNQINDTFPSWLGVLPNLNVLILQSNRFYGVIREPKSNCSFPQLHIIDLSHNRFIGKLPSKYFQCWKALTSVNESQLRYMQDELRIATGDFVGPFTVSNHPETQNIVGIYHYSLTMSSKGRMMVYEKIPYFLTGVILSSNRFDGEIPTSIANLRGLQNLNLSNNNLRGHIPSCLGNLTHLESLDLSNNKLSGKIPQQLVELTFLDSFNVSNNHLTGAIPQGTQFDTFDNSSFDGNWGLCGKPLPRKCENDSKIARNEDVIHDSDSPFAFDWKIVLIGYMGGLVAGVILGLNFSARIQDWFVGKFGRHTKAVRRNRRCRN
ncbi:Receptor-like protein [Melia azedarach]|uniref:Receptor-like protein n=1 Tax=Melia azedarach TaxID=155640 RepID=A0ACC1Y1L6_MELAZ|nr:Receptor-like protein [Melia azedarach]